MTSFQSPKDTYTIIREYARGGMGVTYLVKSEKTGQQLILKQMQLSRVSDWKMVELFEREAEVLRKLNHPQIPRYIDYFAESDNKQFCLVQSFIEGITMQSVIDDQIPVDPDEFKNYLKQCLQILKYLHHMVPPVIHRDITPKNIILHDKKAYIVDFGSVKNIINPESSGLSTSVGTFGYMPPEQIMGQAVPASDLYSLGVSFMALATHSDPMQFPLNPKTGQIETRKLLAHLPENIRAVLEQMTLPGIESRLNDPSEAIRRLDRRPRLTEMPADDTIQAIRTLGTPSFIVKLIEKPQKIMALGMLFVFGIILLIGYFSFSESSDETAAHQPPQIVKKPEPRKNETVINVEPAKPLMAARNLNRNAIDSVLISGTWTGNNGENRVRLTIKRKAGKLTGNFSEYNKRKKDYSGPSSPAEIDVSSLGIITVSTSRISDGVIVSEMYFGNITDDLHGLFGNCERNYAQGGSSYTTSDEFYFTSTKP